MNTAMTTANLPQKTKATSIEGVNFKDGMIVTANDLETAMHYPVLMFQTLVRSYFGCGVVCGIEMTPDPTAGDSTFVLCVGRGVAIDCQGFPIELCGTTKLDLTPDPCSCEPPPTELCIAIRRTTSDEAPADPCRCDTDDPRFQCTRVRDHVILRAFLPEDLKELAGCLCAKTDDTDPSARLEANETEEGSASLCDCLKACPSCDCCGDSWILLGCVTLDEEGIDEIDLAKRKYVKPVDCACAREEDLQTKIAALDRRLIELESHHRDEEHNSEQQLPEGSPPGAPKLKKAKKKKIAPSPATEA